MENYIILKQSGQWLDEIAETLSDYAKFLRLLRFFHCMNTWAMSKFCNGTSQWNKRLSGMSRGKVLLWNETILQKVNIMWMWISSSCRLGASSIYTFSSSS